MNTTSEATSTTNPTTEDSAVTPQRTISGSGYQRVMDQDIKPWELYDLSGARAPDSLHTMTDHFRRFRGLRNKEIGGVSYDPLQI